MAAIFYLSAQSSPPTPGGLPDKLAHAIEYFGLGVVVCRAVAGGLGAQVTGARALATMIITVAYGVSDEVHQRFVPDRTADAGDLLVDAAGASVALIACWAWNIIAISKARVPKPGSRH